VTSDRCLCCSEISNLVVMETMLQDKFTSLYSSVSEFDHLHTCIGYICLMKYSSGQQCCPERIFVFNDPATEFDYTMIFQICGKNKTQNLVNDFI